MNYADVIELRDKNIDDQVKLDETKPKVACHKLKRYWSELDLQYLFYAMAIQTQKIREIAEYAKASGTDISYVMDKEMDEARAMKSDIREAITWKEEYLMLCERGKRIDNTLLCFSPEDIIIYKKSVAKSKLNDAIEELEDWL
jgi:hypothetical protein